MPKPTPGVATMSAFSKNVFAGITNTKNFLRGDAFKTKFIKIPKDVLVKLNSVTRPDNNPLKGLNLNQWNAGVQYNVENPTPRIIIDPQYFEYQAPDSVFPSHGLLIFPRNRDYYERSWDSFYSSYTTTGNNATAFIFKGIYENDCVKLLFEQNVL